MKTAALLIVALLAGCQAMYYGTSSDMNRLRLGMSRAEVLEALGEPSTVAAYPDEERLYFYRMARVTGWSPTTYIVILRSGMVAKYGPVD